MKKYNRIFKTTSLLVLLGGALASCNDFLTVYPQNKITEETFWEDKRDLEGVRYAAYKTLAGQVDKMIIWGDLRSDAYKQNTVISSSQGNRDLYRNMIQADIDTTWAQYDWSGMYTVIGYCNKVINHGQEVLDKDKQFTAAEWKQMKAEMVAIRSLSYFYLVRAFKNVPYTTKVVSSDAEIEYFPQLPALAVMDSIIADLSTVENQARNRFTTNKDTKGMITNGAINAMLADMYLWRASLREGYSDNHSTGTEIDSIHALAPADYKKAIEFADKAICKLGDQFDEEMRSGFLANRDGYISWIGAPMFGRATGLDFMYKNSVDDAHHGNVNMKAYNELFVSQNCYESLLELQFSKEDSRTNGAVNTYWGFDESAHLVSCYSEDNRQDMRHWFSAWKNVKGEKNTQDWYCLKWMNADPSFTENVGKADVKIEVAAESDTYKNWIIYRLSDVLLIEAEAAACLGDLGIDAEANYLLCKNILRMVNRRWYVDVQNGGDIEFDVTKDFTKDPLKAYETKFYTTNWVENVMKTRKIEFMGEGKRWFDLVRWAERNNDGATKHPTDTSKDEDPGMKNMYNTFMNDITGYETARNRCTNMWGLYCPIYYMEMKAYRAAGQSDKIAQNPIWNKSKYDR